MHDCNEDLELTKQDTKMFEKIQTLIQYGQCYALVNDYED